LNKLSVGFKEIKTRKNVVPGFFASLFY